MNDSTVNDVIDSIMNNDKLSTPDKLFMFVTLCDEKTLIQHLKKTAMMSKIGLTVSTPVDSFAYGVMRIAKPHLFELTDKNVPKVNS